jgi:hypothetical protein
VFNLLTPNDPYRDRAAQLTSKRFILYNYSTNIGTEYFKHDIYSPFFLFKMQFIILTYLVLVLFAFYIHDVLKFKKYFRRQKLETAPRSLKGTAVAQSLSTVLQIGTSLVRSLLSSV